MLQVLKHASKIPRREVIVVVCLSLLVASIWCNVYNLTTPGNWSTPVVYGADGWWATAIIKAYQTGEISPLLTQYVASLNAPFGANWNDYPNSEKMLPYFLGILARFIGLFPAFNLAFLFAPVLAAIGFYTVCRLRNFQWAFSFMGAVMFALSHYMFARLGVSHLILEYYWHIPFFLFVTLLCFSPSPLRIGSATWWGCAAIGAVTGLFAVYYAFLFWQFLGFALLAQLLRRNRVKALSVALILVASVGSTVLMALPTVYYRMVHGVNSAAVERSLAGLEILGLKLPELFIPPAHRWNALFEFGQEHYFKVASIRGESGSPYLGVIGIAGILWLAVWNVARLLESKPHRLRIEFWQSIWVILFSVIGGINLLLGVIGMQLIRATDRYSVILLCLALFFLVERLSTLCPQAHRLSLAAVLLLIGLWDILPPFRSDDEIRNLRKVSSSDSDFVSDIERKMPNGARVFQVPVMDFPEVPPHLGVADYTHFRPYLYSRSLHFSYGSNKGRSRESWQRTVENSPPVEMAKSLERYGFHVILIARNGYTDHGDKILNDLDVSGRKVIAQDRGGEFVAVALNPVPANQAELPEVPPFPDAGFYGWEGDWRQGAHTWSRGDGTLTLTNTEPKQVERQYTFALGTNSKRNVTLTTSETTYNVEVLPGKAGIIGPLTLRLPPGETKLRFATDAPPDLPVPGDARQLAFRLSILPAALPEPSPELSTDFYGWEGDWKKGAHSWSKGSSTVTFRNPATAAVTKSYIFRLNSLSKRKVTVVAPSLTRVVELTPQHPVELAPIDLRLAPGPTTVKFETDKPAVPAGDGDTRTITFSLAIIDVSGAKPIQGASKPATLQTP